MTRTPSLPLSGRPEQAALDIVIRSLTEQFGNRAVTTPGILNSHANTLTWVAPEAPDIVVFPMTTDEVVKIVKLCATHHVPIIPFGAGTSFEGHVNAPWGGVSIDTREMKRVLAVHSEDLDCVIDRKSTRLNSSHIPLSRMPSSA